MDAEHRAIRDVSITEPEEIVSRILRTMRRGMRLTRVVWIAPMRRNSQGPTTLVMRFFDGEGERDQFPLGRPVTDLGAASPVLSTGRAALLNPDREMPFRVPYASTPVPLRGAMASPVAQGLVWADRVQGPILEEEYAVFRDLCSILETELVVHESVSKRDERAEYLSRVLEGLQTILTSASESECVAALVESSSLVTKSALGALALITAPHDCESGEPEPLESLWNATVVAAFGDGTRDWVGKTLDASQGLVGVAIRHGSAVPSSRRFARNMTNLLGPDIRLPVREGDSILVYPFGTDNDPLGALILAKGDYDPAIAMYGVRSLCHATALLVQRLRLQQRIARDAMMDALTGLLNRRAFLQHLAASFSLCRRHHQVMSLLMLDADHFKQVNDRYGHLVGDRALRFIAEVIRRGLRGSDLAGRYGGEEFAVVLPHTDLEGALRVAERIRALCSASPVPIGPHRIRLTVSIGVSSLKDTTSSIEDLIAAADMALYTAKRAGRNRVEFIP